MQFAITTQTGAFGPYNSQRAAEFAAKAAGLVNYQVVPFSVSPPSPAGKA